MYGMRKLSVSFLALGVGVAAPIAISGPALGQQISAPALEEIVVTSRKRQESLQSTPVAITAFSDDNLRAMNIASIDQIAYQTPGLVFDTTTNISGSSNSASIFIRGIGQTDFTLVTEPGVGVYIDDAYLPHSIGNVIDVLDIERVEVLRGPQGTLFGRNTIGGAVRVETKKPNDELGGDVELTVGRFNRIDLKAHVNVPVTDQLFVRISGMSADRDGFVDRPLLNGSGGDKDTAALIGQVRYEPGLNFKADLMVSYLRDRSNGSANILLAASSPPGELTPNWHNDNIAPGLVDELGDAAFWGGNQVPEECCVSNTNLPLDQDLDALSTTLTLDWDISEDINLKSISYYRDLETNFGRDADHSPLDIISVDSFIKLESWSEELQLSGVANDGKLNWIVGGYYYKEDGFMDDLVRFSFADLFSGGDAETSSKALYGQASYDLLSDLSVTFGARYSDEKKKFIIDEDHQVITRLFFDSANIRIVPVGTYVTASDGVDFYGNLSYDVTEDLMTYVSYSEGFKGGGFQQRNPPAVAARIADIIAAGGTVDDAIGFGPERAKVYEFGAKYASPNRRIRVNAAVFHTDYNDIQVTVTEGVASVTRNAGNANITGGEIEATLFPIDGLLISGGLGYLDAEYTSLSGDAVGVSLDSKLPHVPEWQLNGAIAYDFITDFGSVTPRVDWSYSSEIFNDAINTEILRRKSHHIINASITFRDPDYLWEIAVFGSNLANERVITSGFHANYYDEGSISRPREWGVRIRREF